MGAGRIEGIGWGVPSLALAGVLATAPCGAAFPPHLFVVTRGALGVPGSAASVELEPPFDARTDLAPVGEAGVARHFAGRHWVVSPLARRVDVLDAGTFETVLGFAVDGTPEDVLVVDETSAWISLSDRAALLEVDPATGDVLGELDLSPFADGDGNPELRRMARDGDRLFVAAQRRDWSGPQPVADSVLVVFDLVARQLVDVDPVLPGVQGVALQGSLPGWDMQVFPSERRLFVSAAGDRLDNTGGIEEVDLDGLRSLGFVLTEEDVGGVDLGGFVMETVDTGFAVFHTDIVPSSHLFRFTRSEGPITGEIHLTFDFVDELALDTVTRRLFVMDTAASVPGIAVVDAATNTLITTEPIPTGDAPADLLVARGAAPGEARDLRVRRQGSGSLLSLSYTPACAATDHDIAVADLGSLRARAWSGRECGIGASGRLDGWDAGAGDSFFVVTGTDGASVEGSYGSDGAGGERPGDPLDHGCPRERPLGPTCD